MISDLYQTKIECVKDSNNTPYYNVNINATDVKIVVSLIDFNGNAVTNKNLVLTVDEGTITSVKSGFTGTVASGGKSVTGTTDNNGQFAVLYTASSGGLVTFMCNQAFMQINIDGMSKTEINTALSGKAASGHNHTTTEMTDSSAYENLGTNQGATQHSINTAVDTKIGALLSLDLISDISDAVSDNDMRPVTSNAVYEEINDINELLMWIMNQDIVVQDNLESTLEELLTEE